MTWRPDKMLVSVIHWLYRFCSRSLDVTTARPTEFVWCCPPPFHPRLTGSACPMNCHKSPSRLSGILSPLNCVVVWCRTAQWVERRTEKPYAGSSPQCGKGYSFQSAFSADFVRVLEELPRAKACINICVHVHNPNAGYHIPLFAHTNKLHTQTCTHTHTRIHAHTHTR